MLLSFSLAICETPEPPQSSNPRLCDLNVTHDESSGDVVVEWLGGSPPFAVLRADNEDYEQTDAIQVLAIGLCERIFTDEAILDSGNRYWYFIMDINSPPMIFGVYGSEDSPSPSYPPPFQGKGAGDAAACRFTESVRAEDENESDSCEMSVWHPETWGTGGRPTKP